MATGFFYKNWQDVGAPTLTPTAGSLVAVLDWALPSADWDIAYTGTNKRVYRAKTGLRPYFRVDDTTTETAVIRMYETMTDVDTGTGMCPDGINQNASQMRASKCDAAENNSHAWHIVGDSEYFIIAINADESYSLDGNTELFYRPFYFGEVASLLVTDNYCAVVGGCMNTSNQADYNDIPVHLFGSQYGRFNGVGTDISGIGDPGVNPVCCFLRNSSGATASDGAYPWADTAQDGGYFRMDVEGPANYAPFMIQSSNGSTSGSSTAWWHPGNGGAKTRARLPYIYRANWLPGNTYGGPKSGDIVTIGASQFVCLVSYSNISSLTWGTTNVNLMRITDDEPDRP